MRPDRQTLLIALLLVLGVICIYSRSLTYDFVRWDDDINVVQNAQVHGLDAKRVAWMFTDTQAALRYKPLSWLTWAVIYCCCGLNPFGFHLANLVLHCLNTVLVFLLLKSLFTFHYSSAGNRVSSLICGWAALLWAIHPLRVEPVVWVTGLPYGLSFFFLLLSLLFYLQSKRGLSKGHDLSCYWTSVFCFLLAVLSYPIGLAYPLVLVVIDFFVLRPWARREHPQLETRKPLAIYLEKVPFFAIAGLFLAITFYGRLHADGIWSKPKPLEDFGLLSRTMQAFYIWAHYLWRYWVPLNLSPLYMTLCDFKPLALPFVLSATSVTGLTLLLVYKRRQWPFLLFLWICHLALLIPMLGLTEHPHFPSDRYGFIVGILWSILLAAALMKVSSCANRRTLSLTAAIALLVGFASLTVRQVPVWQDSVSLFAHTLKQIPHHTKLLESLAAAYNAKGQYREALDCYLEMSRLDPQNILSLERSSSMLLELHRFQEARDQYEKIIQLDPGKPEHHDALGIILAASGDLTNAAAQFAAALRIDPQLSSANRHMAKLLMQQGQPEDAAVYANRLSSSPGQ